jgi:Mannosyl-glycoprotein endo-beta-N-acetylglucosaminidase
MGWQDDPVAEQPAPKQVASPEQFVATYGPIAEQIGAEIGVDPKILLAQFGHETGWGRAIIPGTYNLGNIKDPSGKGPRAKDKIEGSNDAYMRFQDPSTFASYYTDFIKRMYPEAVGAGSDVNKFTAGLSKGVRGAYATDENYPLALRSAYKTVSRINPDGTVEKEDPFSSVPTVDPEVLKSLENVGPAPSDPDDPGVMDTGTAAAVGAGTGLITGTVSKNVRLPTNAKYDSALERLNVARDKLMEARQRGASMGSVPDLEDEFRRAQSVYQQAERELAEATNNMRSTNRPPEAVAGAADDVAASRKVAGSSGAANWTRAMADDVPDVIAESATSMRKADPTGGQALIDKDVAARQKLSQMGLSDYELSGQGKGQLALPKDVAAERTAGFDRELAERQAREAAERTAQAEREAVERARAQDRVTRARQNRQVAGQTRQGASQAVTQARRGADTVSKAQSGVNVAQSALDRTPKTGALAQAGATTAKIAPRALGVLTGAATGYTLADAVNEWNKAYTSYQKTGEFPPLEKAVVRTLEAGFGAMSMLPPASPVTAALRFIGTVGGLGMLGYEGYKAVSENGEDSIEPSASSPEEPR